MNIYLPQITLKTCSCCGVSKEISLFNKDRKAKDGLQSRCRDCSKAYYQDNKEEILTQQKTYKEANPEKVKALDKARKEAHKDDPCFILMRSQDSRIYSALKGIKRAASSKELIGCSWDEMATHIESQFQPGMTWQNHGTWHIDHIRPCSSFDFNDPEQQYECFHYTNTQPLWAADNLTKPKPREFKGV